jgi:preprotein translocase subunit SecB
MVTLRMVVVGARATAAAAAVPAVVFPVARESWLTSVVYHTSKPVMGVPPVAEGGMMVSLREEGVRSEEERERGLEGGWKSVTAEVGVV